MGFRTVVMLNNDRCDEWERDADLGRKISQAMGCANIFGDIAGRERANLGYGLVVECVHSDQDTLVRLSDYEGFHPHCSRLQAVGIYQGRRPDWTARVPG